MPGSTALLVALLMVAPLTVQAQPAKKIARIGFLSPDAAANSSAAMAAFRQGLRELGYVEGQNIAIEWRFAEGSMERLAKLAADLGDGKVDVVVTPDNQAARSLRVATRTVPIVLAGADLRWGLISNLARPGGKE